MLALKILGGIAALILIAVGAGRRLRIMNEDLERIARQERDERIKPPQQ